MIITIITHVSMLLLGYLLGSRKMKSKIYKEVMTYLDSKTQEFEEKMK